MKIKKFFIGIFGLGLMLSSCNLDNDDDDVSTTFTLPCANLVISNNGQESFATRATYNLTFYYMSDKMSVSTSNLTLGPGNTYNFTSLSMPFNTQQYGNKGVNTFSGGSANAPGLNINNIKGYTSTLFNEFVNGTDPENPQYKWPEKMTPLVMSYLVNYDYTVKTFLPDAIYSGMTTVNTVGAQSAPYVNENVRYRVIFSNDMQKATIIFYSAKFADRMPITITFALEDLDVNYLANGYEITIPAGSTKVPVLYLDGAWNDAPNYLFTSFRFINTSEDLTTGTAFYTVQMGQASYNCDFTGRYVFEDNK